METPEEAKKRGSKSVVKRDVVRLVTPGTLIEDSLLEARRHNFLAALGHRSAATGPWPGADISTGRVSRDAPVAGRGLAPNLRGWRPSELLLFRHGQRTPCARCWVTSGSTPRHWARPAFDIRRCRRGGCAQLFKVQDPDRLWGVSTGRNCRRWARWSTTSTSPRRAACRCCARHVQRTVSAADPADRRRHAAQPGTDRPACRADASRIASVGDRHAP